MLVTKNGITAPIDQVATQDGDYFVTRVIICGDFAWEGLQSIRTIPHAA